jgi:hypothetical protein
MNRRYTGRHDDVPEHATVPKRLIAVLQHGVPQSH